MNLISMNMKEIIMNRKTLQHMIKRIYQLIFILLFAVSGVMAQTVKVHDVVEAPGVILVPVDMLNYQNVGGFTLNLEYDSDLLNFTGIENLSLTGQLNANFIQNENVLRIIFLAPPNIGYNINGKLLDIKFNYKGGFSTDVILASGCEIVTPFLQVIPSTFINGSVAQIDTDNTVTLVNPGAILVGNTATIPVTIEGPGYGAVNSITLKVAYNPAQLTYAGKVDYAIPGATAAAGNGMLTINWNGAAQDFTSLTTLLDLKFVYYGGGDANLNFYPGSEIADNMSIIATEYIGTFVTPYFEEPTLTLGTINGTPGTGVTIPVTATDFGSYQVGAMTLKVTYDPAKLTFTGFTAHQSITGWAASAAGGILTLNRSNVGGVTISDGLLLGLNFNYNGGGLVPVVFGPGTELKTIHSVTIPVGFVNGMVIPEDHDAKLILAQVGGVPGFPVTVPLTAEGFDPSVEVGSITIKVGYPGNKLIFTSYTATNSNFTGWVVNNTTNEVVFTWSDLNGSVMNDGVLLELHFNYPGTSLAPVVFNPGVELRDTDLNLIPLGLVNGYVSTGFRVAGSLLYANNAQTPLDNSTVYLKSPDGLTTLASTTTDANGNFEFLFIAPGSYMLDASTTKLWGGVDGIDAFLIYYYATTGIPPLVGIHKTAGDVDLVNNVDAIDAFIVYYNQPPHPAWIAPEWIFDKPIITVSGADVNQNILGVCSGDVDGSYNP